MTVTPMWYDLAILAILAFTLLRGAAKGLVWQVAWIAALILCFTVSEKASPRLAVLLPMEAPLNRWVAMFMVYVASVFVTFWFAHRIRDWMDKHRFKEFDRHLGAIFGLVKGVLFALTLTFFAVTLSPDARELVLKSRSGYAAAIVMDRLHPVMSDEFHEALEEYIHQLDDAADAPDLHNSHEKKADSSPAKDDPPEVPRPFGISAPPTVNPVVTGEGVLGQVERSRLLLQIAKLHTTSAVGQAAISADISASLAGLPDKIAAAVLNDWLADLSNRRPDPDPQTSEQTLLDHRIARQLAAANIPLTQLGSRLRNRLENSATR